MKPEESEIRPFREDDLSAVCGVWHRSGKAAYPYLPLWQSLTIEKAREIFPEAIAARCRIWVGTKGDRVVAFLAMDGSVIDKMYVDPDEWGNGWGTRLLALAKQIFPGGLQLHTHQQNTAARRFYENHGFRAVGFGVSPPPETAPDVEYRWRRKTE